MGIDTKLSDDLLVGHTKPVQIIDENGLLKQLTSRFGTDDEAEMGEHLGLTVAKGQTRSATSLGPSGKRTPVT